MAGTTVSSGGLRFLPALALLFIGLKLGGVIEWSWWWVLCPLWGPPALVLSIASLFALAVLAVQLIARIRGC